YILPSVKWEKDVTVTIPEGGTLTNQGTLKNEGELKGDGTLRNEGKISNEGTIAIKGSIISSKDAQITGEPVFSAEDEAEKEKEELRDYIEEAKEVIDDMEKLSEEEKEAAKKVLDEQYETILKDLKDSDSRKTFEQAKKQGEDQIDQIVTEQNKKQYENDTDPEQGTTITGSISVSGDASTDDVKVTLRIGNTILKEAGLDEDGKYTFHQVPDGVYNIVTSNKTQQKTSYVTVKNGVVQLEKETLLDDKNTTVKVKNGAPDVCVDGLDEVFKTDAYENATKEDASDLMQSEVRLTASRSKNPSDMIKQAMPENKEVTRYMEFTTDLYLTWSSGATKVFPLSDTGTLLLVAVPLKNSEKGKTGYQVYRSHIEDGTEVVETLPQLSEAERVAPEKEGFYMDADYAYIYCQKFSTYAIAYDKKNAEEATTTVQPTTEAAATTAAQATTEAAATVSKDAKKKTAKKETVSGNDLAKLKNLPLLLAKGKGGNKKISLSWLKVKKTTKYEIYWSVCDGKTNYKLLKRTNKTSSEHKKLSNKRAYKYFVIAYRTVKGKKEYLAKSPTLHVAMKQDKKTNVKKVTANYKTLTLQNK
ncbi:MAG: hypothetical protein SOT70_07690, partial [Lachnospiraceae bacterium]|nr:hypothetical protein [Lachnospiraceae bacterium]